MNNNILLSVGMSSIPVLAIGFVILLVIYKIYIKIRSRFNINVNCWFCNKNTKVPYLNANSWTCPSCEQYNGFDKDGNYNREIYEQLNCSHNSDRFNVSQLPSNILQHPPQNGFCDECNESQRLKLEKLAQFEAKNEAHWDREIKAYKEKLEDQYRLCFSCDRHLNKVLKEKKKMVLGSKFLDFIIKGAENLKQPHLNEILHASQQKKKLRYRSLIIIMSLINLYCLIISIPSLSRDHFIKFLGESLGSQLFLIASHFLALSKVTVSYLAAIKKYAVFTKISLFSRTIFLMIMYSMGLKVTHFSFTSLYISLCPFVVLSLAFMHNVVDGFRLTRYTGMLVVWSLFAGGLIEETGNMLTPQILMFFTSFLTFIFAYTSKLESSPKLNDSTSNSFHKIYSEDYHSDDDSMSMLSQQINSSCVSTQSVRSNKSSPLMDANASPRLTRPSLASSAFSLYHVPHSQLSPNYTFRSYSGGENQILRSASANPMVLAVPSNQGLFASNLELNRGHRPLSTVFGMNASVANATLLNNCFTENDKSLFTHNTRNNSDSFFAAANKSGKNAMYVQNGRNFAVESSHSGLHSPFSVTATAMYHHQQRQNQRPYTHEKILSPTRFCTNTLSSSNASWLSGGYFNQRQSASEVTHNGLTTLHAQSLRTPMQECISRSSSHSSGFESQNGRPNGNLSRENSLCVDFGIDSQHRAINTDNTSSFQPIDTPNIVKFSPRPSLLSNPSLNNTALANTDIWKQATFTHKSNAHNQNFIRNTMDSFNLRKINEELPSINKGDLLKRWNEGQTL